MKVIGFSSGSVGREGNVDRMVQSILEKSGHETEYIKQSPVHDKCNYSLFSSCALSENFNKLNRKK